MVHPYPPSPLVRIHSNCHDDKALCLDKWQWQWRKIATLGKYSFCISKWFYIYSHTLLNSLLRGRLKRQDCKTQISERVTREHIHHKSSLFENPQCHLCKFWPSLLPTNDLLLPHIQDRRNLFDRPLPICLAFEKIHSFFESEVESIGFLWGSGRGAMYINLISTKKLLLTWRFFPTLYKRLKHNKGEDFIWTALAPCPILLVR